MVAITEVQLLTNSIFSLIGEMVSFVVWDHEAQVRFLHRRPVFWAVSANGNTSGLQPEIESSILSRSTKLWAISKMNITQGYEP